jgi:hypothetical protein
MGLSGKAAKKLVEPVLRNWLDASKLIDHLNGLPAKVAQPHVKDGVLGLRNFDFANSGLRGRAGRKFMANGARLASRAGH